MCGRGCCKERSRAWAVKPGAHDGKLLLHCLVTRSGIIGLARALAGFFAHVRDESPRCACSRGAGANTALAARRLAGLRVYNNACKHFRELSMCIYKLSRVKYIEIIDDKNYPWRSNVTPQYSLTNKDGRRKGKARVPIRTRFLPSADSISDKSRASHLSHLITSLHAALPEVVRHSCMSHHIDRSICMPSVLLCMHVSIFCHNAFRRSFTNKIIESRPIETSGWCLSSCSVNRSDPVGILTGGWMSRTSCCSMFQGLLS